MIKISNVQDTSFITETYTYKNLESIKNKLIKLIGLQNYNDKLNGKVLYYEIESFMLDKKSYTILKGNTVNNYKLIINYKTKI